MEKGTKFSRVPYRPLLYTTIDIVMQKDGRIIQDIIPSQSPNVDIATFYDDGELFIALVDTNEIIYCKKICPKKEHLART